MSTISFLAVNMTAITSVFFPGIPTGQNLTGIVHFKVDEEWLKKYLGAETEEEAVEALLNGEILSYERMLWEAQRSPGSFLEVSKKEYYVGDIVVIEDDVLPAQGDVVIQLARGQLGATHFSVDQKTGIIHGEIFAMDEKGIKIWALSEALDLIGPRFPGKNIFLEVPVTSEKIDEVYDLIERKLSISFQCSVNLKIVNI